MFKGGGGRPREGRWVGLVVSSNVGVPMQRDRRVGQRHSSIALGCIFRGPQARHRCRRLPGVPVGAICIDNGD
jgi:hypothetical protein